MNSIDLAAMTAANSLRSPTFDAVMHYLLISDIKMGVLAALLLCVWLCPRGAFKGNEAFILQSIMAILSAMAVTFVGRHLLPQRPRPRLIMPDFPFPPLDGLDRLWNIHSFPSDTATLAGALTMVIWARSRKLGSIAAVWSVAAVCFPRLYIGYHRLSDVVVGFLIGVVTAWLLLKFPMTAAVKRARLLSLRWPVVTSVMIAIFLYQLSSMFGAVQTIGEAVKGHIS